MTNLRKSKKTALNYRNIQLTIIYTILGNSVRDRDMAVEVHDYLSTNDAV